MFTLLKTEHSQRKQMLPDLRVIVPCLKVICYVLTLWKLFLTSFIDFCPFFRNFAVIALSICCSFFSQVQILFQVVVKQSACIFWYLKFLLNRLWPMLVATCIYLSSVVNLFFILMHWWMHWMISLLLVVIYHY